MNTPTPTLFSRLSTHQDSPFTRPCSGADQQPETNNFSQQPTTKPSKHNCNPTIQHPVTPSHCPAISCPASTSHIPAPHHNPFPRPINHSSKPFTRPINNPASPITRPSTPTPDDIYQFLTHLIAMNGYLAVKEADKSIPE